MPSLQQLLVQQPPTTSGIHEAMLRHTEDIFETLRGILPLFLGKRQIGPFINLALPNRVTESSENLLQTIGDLILVYNLRVVSLVTAIRLGGEAGQAPRIGALLLTADRAKAYFQLSWQLSFDSQGDIAHAVRSDLDSELIPRAIWSELFSQTDEAEARSIAYERLVERFGGPAELPKP